ncbi:MAG TPA: MMPL family transporter, partial [Ktedonobacterales bacterium]|nr:MMPL family transporter [Ktedonobacterales bacterium]
GAESDGKLHTHGLYRLGFNYGRAIYRLRWLVIALWAVGLAVSLPFAAQLTSKLTGGGYQTSSSESVSVGNTMVDRLHAPPSTLLVVFHSDSVAVSDAAYQAQVSAIADKFRAYPHVTSVVNAGPGTDGKTTYLAVNFDKSNDYVEQQIPDITKMLPSGSDAGPATIYLTGSPAIYAEFTSITQHDAERAEMFALPVALLVLLIVFGSLLAALTPLTLALVAVPVAMAIIYPIAAHNEMSVFVLNIATIVGLGISIDYSLFMTRRFREELGSGRSVRDAVAWTVSTAGEAILFSGLTVIIGFAGMLLIGIQFMTSIGLGGMCVVAAAVLAALTLLPALLSVLGHRVNALRVPLIGKLVARRGHEIDANGEQRGFWHGWALAVMRRPVLIIIGVCAVLVVLGWPILSINIGTPTSTSLPATAASRQGIELVNAQFPSSNENPVYIIAKTPDGSSMMTAENLAKLDSLSNWLSRRAHVTGVTSLTMLPQTEGGQTLTSEQLIALYTTGAYQQDQALARLVGSTTDKDITLITLNTNAPVDSAEGKALIDDLRNHYGEGSEGLTIQVGGFQAISLDFNNYLYGNFPKAIAFILGATFILLLLMFRSLLLPLKAVIMNVLSVSAAYGVLVFIFQEGHFSNLLGFTSNGFIDSTVPILLFCILFGLSMDYEVFLLSRIREEWLRTHNNRYAVARGLEKTGGVITNAALLFIIVAGSFVFTGIVIMKETGLGMTLAVLIDATIIRTLLVPATMRLLGRWNWWLPGRKLPVEQPAPSVQPAKQLAEQSV